MLLPFRRTRHLLLEAEKTQVWSYFVVQVLVLDLPPLMLPLYILHYNAVANTNVETLLSLIGAVGMIAVTLCRAVYVFTHPATAKVSTADVQMNSQAPPPQCSANHR